MVCFGKSNSQDSSGLCEKEAGVQLHKDARHKEMGVYLPQHGHWLCESENGIYLPQREETSLPSLSLCLSTCPYAVPPHRLTHSTVMASFPFRTLLSSYKWRTDCPIFHMVLHVWRSAAGWHALRGEITWLQQMTNADSHVEEEEVRSISKLALYWKHQLIESEGNAQM